MQTKIDKAFRCWQYRLGQVWVPELVESPLSCSEYQTDLLLISQSGPNFKLQLFFLAFVIVIVN